MEDDGQLKFMFVYEDKSGNLFTDLNSIQKEDGDLIKIFPVYVSGHNDNLTEETLTYQNGELIPSEENKETSWLTVIQNPEIEIIPFDIDQIVVYNNRLFHCEKDLLVYLEENGPEYLPVSNL